MSADVISAFNQNAFCLETQEDTDAVNVLEKCGEVFLDRHFGDLVFVCGLCDDSRFGTAEDFSSHITDIHVSIENFIAYEPHEQSDSGDIVEIKNEMSTTFDHNEKVTVTLEKCTDSLDFLSVEEEEPEAFEMRLCEGENTSLTDLSDQVEEKIFEDEKENESQPDKSDEEILRSKLSCKFCGEQFDYVKNLRQHDCGLSKKKKTYVCSFCGKIFKKKSGLDIHSLLHKGEKPHKCDICGSAYACKQNLIVHIRRHTGEKPFKCDHCDRRFASSTERISHMRTHTGDRPFVCELCGKGHSSSSQLTGHMNRHLDIRNYECEICSKRFRNSYNLRMHRLTHEKGPRQFSCEQCSAAFKTSSSLMQHMKIHEKVKKYVCKICNRSFAQHPGLYSHMKSHASVAS